MSESLSTTTVKGTLWIAISRFFSTGFQAVTTAVLARLLTPADFGAVKAAAIPIQLAAVINDLGLNATIIRHKDLTRDQLSTLYWLSVMTGVLMWIVCIAFAPLAGRFFGNDQVPGILRLIALTFILNSLMSVHQSRAVGQLRFGTAGAVKTAAAFASGAGSILLAISGVGVYSLAWGQVINSLSLMLLWWVVWRWWPRLVFRPKRVGKPLLFGMNAMGSSLVNTVSGNVDNAVTGRSLGSQALGYYSEAFHWAMAPYRRIGGIVNQVLLPTFSNIQDDHSRLQRGYCDATKYMAILVFPIAAGLAVVAPEFVNLLYGGGWETVVIPLRLLAFASMAYALGTLVGPACYACGRPGILLKFNLVKTVVVGSIVVVGARFGVVGVSVGMLIWAWGALLVLQHRVNRLIGLSMRAYIESFRLPGIAVLVMTLFTVLARFALERAEVDGLVLLMSLVLLGSAIYLAILAVFGGEDLRRIFLLGRRAIGQMLGRFGKQSSASPVPNRRSDESSEVQDEECLVVGTDEVANS